MNMAADEGICNVTCVKMKPKKPCSDRIGTCPKNECVGIRNQHCDYECNGNVCGSECQSKNERCRLKCTGIYCEVGCNAPRCKAECEGIGCIARCNGEKCVALCTGKNCTATCEGQGCVYSELTVSAYFVAVYLLVIIHVMLDHNLIKQIPRVTARFGK
ncbi:uncharacterized protein LOC134794867 [Cydia splendana]|uniref:uncharacterized protein LOC134794867 n=1 Tax=Cydia splendana TaxID=1100963 RepID=UPI00300C24C6